MPIQATPRGDKLGSIISKCFLATGLVFGLAYTFMTPPLRVPDEASHFFRAYTTSHGFCIGSPAILAPIDWRQMDTRNIWTELPENTSPQQMANLMRPPEKRDYDFVGAFAVGNIYNCLPYLPGGIGIASASLFGGSPLILMYAGRIANLLSYLALIYFALKLLPAFHLLMATIALMPMALHQAGSLSADNPAIALSCLFIAYLLRLAFGEPRSFLTRKQLLTLAVLIVALALCKTLLYLSLLVLLLPPSRFTSKKQRWLWIGSWCALAAVSSFGWQWINRANVERVTAIRGEHGILMAGNLHYIISDPVGFGEIVFRTISSMKYEYLQEFVGKLGWLNVPLPGWLVWTYLATLLLVAVSSNGLRLGLAPRVLFGGLAVFNALSAFAVVWTFETTTAGIAASKSIIYGVQGRYLIPFAFPLFVAVAGPWLRVGKRWIGPIALCAVIAANGIAVRAMGDAYYYADSSLVAYDVPVLGQFFSTVFARPATIQRRYEHKLVQRPGTTLEDAKVYFISQGQKHWVVNGGWIIAHGYRWPYDVRMISAEDLEAIPLGEPITATH
jgi:uncharacterized membrane protein